MGVWGWGAFEQMWRVMEGSGLAEGPSHEQWCKSQTLLGFCVAVAAVSPAAKKQNKKKKNKKKNKEQEEKKEQTPTKQTFLYHPTKKTPNRQAGPDTRERE